MNKETTKPAETPIAELEEQIGKTPLEQIIKELGLPSRDAYGGEELQEILGVQAKMKQLRIRSVKKAVAAYIEAIGTEQTESEATTSSKKVTPRDAKSKLTAQAKQPSGDLQKKYLGGKQHELKKTVEAGSQEGQQLADAYRFGKQTAFLKTSIQHMLADAATIGEELSNLNAAIYNQLQLPENYLEGLDVPEITELFAEVDGVECGDDKEDSGAGLGFTGLLGELCQGNLTDDEATALLSGEELELEPEEEEETEPQEGTPLLQLVEPPGLEPDSTTDGSVA